MRHGSDILTGERVFVTVVNFLTPSFSEMMSSNPSLFLFQVTGSGCLCQRQGTPWRVRTHKTNADNRLVSLTPREDSESLLSLTCMFLHVCGRTSQNMYKLYTRPGGQPVTFFLYGNSSNRCTNVPPLIKQPLIWHFCFICSVLPPQFSITATQLLV